MHRVQYMIVQIQYYIILYYTIICDYEKLLRIWGSILDIMFFNVLILERENGRETDREKH